MKFAIFSGRFDPLHAGHIQSIIKIGMMYDHVIVPILDYPKRMVQAKLIRDIFDSLFGTVAPLNNITFVINNIHFAEITEEQYLDFIKEHIGIASDVTYLSGNPKVIEHFEQLGLKCEFFERSMDNIYTGTNIRKEIIENGYI